MKIPFIFSNVDKVSVSVRYEDVCYTRSLFVEEIRSREAICAFFSSTRMLVKAGKASS